MYIWNLKRQSIFNEEMTVYILKIKEDKCYFTVWVYTFLPVLYVLFPQFKQNFLWVFSFHRIIHMISPFSLCFQYVMD